MNHVDEAEHWNQTGEQRGWRRQTLWDQWQSTTLCMCVYLCVNRLSLTLNHFNLKMGLKLKVLYEMIIIIFRF